MIACLVPAKVWLINKVNVSQAAVLELGLFSANGNQSRFCLLRTGWDNFMNTLFWLLKIQCCPTKKLLFSELDKNASCDDS